MPSLVFNTGFEFGALNSAASASLDPAAGQYAISSTITGTPIVTVAAARSGSYGLRCQASTATAAVVFLFKAAGPTVAIRFYYRQDLSPTPTDNTEILRVGQAAGGAVPLILKHRTGGAIELWSGASTLVDTSSALAADTWYQIDILWDTSVSPHVLSWAIDGVSEGSNMTGAANAPLNIDFIRFGSVNVAVFGFDFDDVAISSNGSADYPLGAGYGGLLLPSSLTINSVGTFVQDNTATAITSGDWARLDDIPLSTESSSYIRQTVGSSDLTNGHPAIGFSNTSTDTINGVRAMMAYSAASTAAMNSRVWARANSTDTYLHGSSSTQPTIGVTTTVTAVNQVLNGGVAWTDSMLDGLVIRFGSGAGTDVSPIPRYNNFLLEVDYAPVPPRHLIIPRRTSQALHRAVR